jgi:hypothetical protein
MTSSVPSTVDFIGSFPIQPIKITGMPTYATLTLLRNELQQNAATIPSNRGGGSNGYLGTIMSGPMYDTVAPGQPYTIPAYPGAQPTVPAGATGPQISEAVRLHNESLREWREYTNIHNALKKQLEEAIEPVYLRSQRHRHVGFANRSVRELLAYLFQAYGQLNAQKLIDNQTTMNKAWDPSTPFETLIEQIEDAMEVADAANQAFSDAQILTLSYTLVYNTGLYFDECKEWKAKPAGAKTWDTFKIFFLVAQAELREQQQATSGRSGFSAHTHNQEQQTAEALASLGAAQESDRQAFCQLVTTNSELADQLKLALGEITTLKSVVNQIKTKTLNKPRKLNDNYCWTHGFRVADEHTSKTCKNPKPGHQQEATKTNQMGGSTAGTTN